MLTYHSVQMSQKLGLSRDDNRNLISSEHIKCSDLTE